MNIMQLAEKFKLTGPFDIVLTSDSLAECEGYGEKGMCATVVGVRHEDGGILVDLDYTKFDELNTPKESPDYQDGKTATEAGMKDFKDSFFYDPEFCDDDQVAEAIEDNSLFYEYAKSGARSYVAWLELELLKERAKPKQKLSVIVGHDDSKTFDEPEWETYLIPEDTGFEGALKFALDMLEEGHCVYICNTKEQLENWNLTVEEQHEKLFKSDR